ncbi:hypothetical protein A0H76_642 [Hepatospora eriocheir]|uniref:Uncharacterized protein n=1 Tax=Hepatospora eriocheir TaxID=1081669 RepID=A0A1X0Q7K2_9MICR|nr:hypothetical protein A0H76_642 [Hepatospora eriocheir]
MVNMSHNATYHTSLDCAPMQLAFGRSRYYSDKIENIHKLLNTANNYKDKKSLKNLEKKNKNRKTFNFNGTEVYVKNREVGKLTQVYIGPFKVIKDNPDFNTLTVDREGKPYKYTYREVKPSKEEEDVVPSTTNKNDVTF